MKDKIVLITGATGGIGFQTALTLAKMGPQLIITGRGAAAGEQAAAELQQKSANPRITFLQADLSVRSDLRQLADAVRSRHEHLDVLINNAGSAAASRILTADGIELNFAVNVLAPFLLTRLLLDPLRAAPSARVVTLMGGDLPAVLDLDNLQAERSFDGLNSYSQSKLAMMAVMLEFARREPEVAMNVCYPGQASTAMTRGVTPDMLPRAMRWMFPIFKIMTRPDGGRSAAKASRSSVHLASSPEVEGLTGKYFDTNCREVALPKAVLDGRVREILWERMIK